MFRALAVCFMCCLFACAQERVGLFSQPYFEGSQPSVQVPSTYYEQDQMQTLEFAGYRLRFALDNDIQTAEIFWAGAEVPMLATDHDGKHKWRQPLRPGPYCLSLRVQSERSGGRLLPRDVVLEIDGQRYTPSSARHSAYGEQAVVTHVLEPGESVALSTARADNFTLCFEVDRPEPARQIRLELGEALVHPDGLRIPRVNFILTGYRAWQ